MMQQVRFLIQYQVWMLTSIAVGGILLSLCFWLASYSDYVQKIPLWAVLVTGGTPLLLDLFWKALRLEFGADLLGGISIVVSLLLGEYLAGAIIVLMLSGGAALESYAVGKASGVLKALAKRMPQIAHKKMESAIVDVPVGDIEPGDRIFIYPHEHCPVDGEVVQGHGAMDESYLTGEPFRIVKTLGAAVISGAINGESVFEIEVRSRAADSRYARIMQVMEESQANQPQLKRLGDQLGALYTPLALVLAILAWGLSGESVRFLAVLVIATPCPLLIAIPISIIGAISLSAKRGMIVKSPVALEQAPRCRIAIFDKTGTLTYGQPELTGLHLAAGWQRHQILQLLASLERYSKHPLATAIVSAAAAEKLELLDAKSVSEPPGQGLIGLVDNCQLEVTGRKRLQRERPELAKNLPTPTGGLECLLLIDDNYAATLQFHDTPRPESGPLVKHLGPNHQFERVILLSGDRESEVRYLAEQVGICDIYADQQPEQKLKIVQELIQQNPTLYVGDGINDAPAMLAATVGLSIGQQTDVAAAAADVVIMDNRLSKVDEFLHISHRMRSIALQSAVGGMLLSLCGMFLAAFGYLSPVQGAIGQEMIDVLAITNALRASVMPAQLTDYEQ